ncbi:MAG: AsmA-like C-terminal region-containing protein [Deltaproteobacteria bacterium]
MRKRAAVAFSVLAALVAVVLLAPFFLPLKRMTADALDAVSREIRGTVTFGKAEWRWLPAPGLRVSTVRVDTREVSVEAPLVLIRPDVRSLFSMRFLVALDLDSPVVRVKGLPEGPGVGGLPEKFPITRIAIQDGSVACDEGAKWADRFRKDVLAGTGVSVEASFSKDEISFEGSFRAPFVKNADVKGVYRPLDRSYKATFLGDGLRPHLIIPKDHSGNGFTLVDSGLSVHVHMEGKGTDVFTARLSGEAPCLTFRPQGRNLAFSCGYFNAVVKRNGKGLGIEISELKATDPSLSLKGTLSRTQGEDETGLWDVDLTFADADLGGIREKLLTLFGGEKRVSEVCDVVRGGVAREARYRFTGRSSELGRLEAMTVTALLQGAEIHVPRPDLLLDQVSGPIRIEDGLLSGSGLSARLGGIEGENGDLVLRLTQKDKAFRLEGDFRGKVSEVPPLLERIFSQGVVREEIPRIGEVTGEASIHLSIGDDRERPSVRIGIKEADCAVSYGRLPWPVSPRGGEVVISHDQVSWEGLSGLLGPHEVKASAGSVTWKDGIRIEIQSVSGSVDVGPLRGWLASFPKIAGAISRVVTTAGGRMDVEDGSFLGGPEAPDKWEFRLSARARPGVTFVSPLLPGAASVKSGSGTITRGSLSLRSITGELDGQPIQVSGDLSHDLFRKWRGKLVLAGTAREGIARWVEEKGWIPEPYMPAVPCKVDDLRISWGEGPVSVKGDISPDAPRGTPAPVASIDLDVHKGAVSIRAISVRDGASVGDFSLDFHGPPDRSFSVGFSGELNGRSLDRLLQRNDLLHGEISGTFHADYDPAHPLSGRIAGDFAARDLVWRWGLARPVLVRDLAVMAEGIHAARINRLVLAHDGESVEGNGEVSVTDEGISFNLDIGGGRVSSGTIRDLLAPAPDGRDGKGTGGMEKGDDEGGWNVGVRSQVLLDAFELVRQGKGPLVFHPLKGVLVIEPTGRTRFDVTHADLCGLGVAGAVHWERGEMDVDVAVRSASGPQKAMPRLETTLSCLGLGQDIIEGDFTTDIQLSGRYPLWDSGSVAVSSSGGRIRRLTLLAKVFSVVNVLDIFSGGLPDLFTEGFAYDRFDMEGAIADNVFEIEHLYVNGKGLNIFAEGKVDLAEFDSDLTILIAPFKTVDFVLRNIPLIGRVFGGKDGAFISIPVGVRGPLSDPSVTILPPSAVGSGLLGFVERTLKLPFTIFSPLSPSGKEAGRK